jgi:hypothetical protein
LCCRKHTRSFLCLCWRLIHHCCHDLCFFYTKDNCTTTLSVDHSAMYSISRIKIQNNSYSANSRHSHQVQKSYNMDAALLLETVFCGINYALNTCKFWYCNSHSEKIKENTCQLKQELCKWNMLVTNPLQHSGYYIYHLLQH